MKKRLILDVFFLFLIGFSLVKNLSGLLTGSSNQPLQNVHVCFVDLHRGSVTTNIGVLSFLHLPAKNLKVQFSSLGYKTLVRVVDMLKGNQRINLAKLSSVIEELVLSGGFVSSQDWSVVKICSKKLSSFIRSESLSSLKEHDINHLCSNSELKILTTF